MRVKLEVSLKSLSSWVDKILTDSKGSDWRLQDFKETYNIKDFQVFYHELQPFVTKLNNDEPELFEKLVTIFESNAMVLSEAMKDNFFYDLLLSLSLDMRVTGRSADDLILALKEIHSNVKNLENALKVFSS